MIPIQPMIFDTDNEYWTRLIYKNVDPNRYLISTYGNIFDYIENSLVKIQNISENNRYLTVYLTTTNGRKHRFLLHLLVANAFIFDQNINRVVVNHKDGDKANPHVSNLEFTTHKENTQHAIKSGLFKPKGHNDNNLTEKEVVEICEMLQNGLSYASILNNLGLDNSRNNRELIANIYRRKAWTKISNNYNFPNMDRKLFYTHNEDTIRKICTALEAGKSYREIFEYAFNREYQGSLINKKEYELIRRIKNRQLFTSISKDYKF